MGSTFYLVVPTARVKKPLFDHARLAATLSTMSHHPHDAFNLPFTNLTFTKDHKTFHFQVDSTRYEWSLAAQTLKSLGKIARDSILDRLEAMRGYTLENTRLLCRSCDFKIQSEREFS